MSRRAVLPFPFSLRRMGAGAGEVVLVAGGEVLEIKFVIDEVVQGVFKGAGQKRLFEIDGNECGLVSLSR